MASTSGLDILLATWNGAPFLGEQLASLFGQTRGDFRVLARDDGSSDGTADILQDWSRRHPGRITLLAGDGARRGTCGNFAELLRHSTAPYVMFCDQDDRWHTDKVELSLARMRELEAEYGAREPLLVHGDLRVVDAGLATIAASSFRYQRIDPVRGAALHRLLVRNVVSGCAMTINRPLAELSLPIPEAAIMHDWWIALTAAACGRIRLIPQALVDYRQHGGNQLGAPGTRLGLLVRKALQSQARSWRQAEAFLLRHRERLSGFQREVVTAYSRLGERGFIDRRRQLLRYGFWKHGWVNNLGLFLAV
jgi:glycosyltransferase involved in cell wall biosynthesis